MGSRNRRPPARWRRAIAAPARPAATTGAAITPPLPYINMSNWDNEPVPEQEWTVLNRIPRRQCVLFSGEGGFGKSTVQLHLCAAHVLGRDWLGTMPEQGPALFIDAEDDEKVMHQRLAAITRKQSSGRQAWGLAWSSRYSQGFTCRSARPALTPAVYRSSACFCSGVSAA